MLADHSSGSTKLEPIAYCFFALSVVRIALTFLFFQAEPKVATAIQGLISVTAAFALVFVIVSAGLAAHSVSWSRVTKWILIYIVWAGVSLLWTFSDALISAVGYWALMLLDVLIVGGLLRFGNVERVGIASLKGLVVGTYLIDSIALLFANGDPNGRLGDPAFLHPNNLGHFTALAALISLFLWQREEIGTPHRRWWALNSLILSWLVIRTLSKTSIVAFMISAAFALIASPAIRAKTKLAALVASGVLLVGSYGFLSAYIGTYIEDNADDVTTLTGRTILWVKSAEMILERPLTGYGVLSFRNYAPQDWDIRTVHGHNEWITQAFQLGLVGIGLSIMVYASYFFHIRKVRQPLKRTLGMSLLIFILIEGMASAEPVGLLFPLPLLFLLSTWSTVPFAGTDDGGLPRSLKEHVEGSLNLRAASDKRAGFTL